ncbi:MAG: CDP-diacylglycerol--serine O-phosphatidyltransferase [Thalassobaculum sp.]|uniref:CDP-diacylglycerol--serine O-phosphatidyltransferase n=1 Tax=Thalassobaculum sp. TaxID=2022740 RepID=UPI0032EB4223
MKRLRRRRSSPRFSGQSFNKLIPNLITVLAVCFGLSGLRYALAGKWEFAVGMIVLAAVFDALDGRMARLLRAQSKFGAELDSLSDFVSFGVAPGIIVYLWALQSLGNFGWMAGLFYATCCMLRLARFNTKLDDDKPAFTYNYFTGVPAPAGAGLALLPMMLAFQTGLDLTTYPPLMALWLVLVGLLMVSQLPTFSFKRMKVPQRMVLPILIGAGLIITGVVSAPWFMLALLIIAYLGSIPLSVFAYRRLLKEAEQMAEASPATVDETEPRAGTSVDADSRAPKLH